MDDHDELPQRLRSLGTRPINPARQSADLTAMAGVRTGSRVRPKLRVAGAFLAGLLIGSTGLAAADALPDPAQHVAHTVLASVGVKVPNPARYYDSGCGITEKKNHGSYVRDNHELAKSDCGKKVKAAGATDEPDTDEDGVAAAKPDKAAKADKGPCHGKPAWAEDKSLAADAKADAEAERSEACGPDDDADVAEVEDEIEAEAEAETEVDPDVDDELTEASDSESTEPAGEE